MASITYSQAAYSIISLKSFQEISTDIDVFEIITNLILKNKIQNSSEIYSKGWMAYQFDPTKDRITSEPIEIIEIGKREVLVVTHLSVEPKPYPKKISNIIQNEDIDKDIKEILMKEYSKSFFNDVIFIKKNPEVWIIIPTDKTDWFIEHILNPTFGELFTFNYIDKVHIPIDLLEWLLLKIKKRKNGALNKMKIINVIDYRANTRGTIGNLDIEIENVENNLFTQLSVGIRNVCRHVLMTVSYNNREYTFFLPEGMGKFQPFWSYFKSLGTGSYKMDRVADLIIIALEIIPHIVSEYRKDNNWQNERNEIFEQELTEAKEKIP